jgi:hypothetical protein
MATKPFVKFFCFVEDVCEKKHNLGSDVLKVMLTNTDPTQSATVYTSGIASSEIANGNGYTTGGVTPTISSSAQSGGIYKLVLADVSWTAGPSAMATFRYAVLYNTTGTTPLIGYWDNGVTVSLASAQVFTIDFDGTIGVLQVQ